MKFELVSQVSTQQLGKNTYQRNMSGKECSDEALIAGFQTVFLLQFKMLQRSKMEEAHLDRRQCMITILNRGKKRERGEDGMTSLFVPTSKPDQDQRMHFFILRLSIRLRIKTKSVGRLKPPSSFDF